MCFKQGVCVSEDVLSWIENICFKTDIVQYLGRRREQNLNQKTKTENPTQNNLMIRNYSSQDSKIGQKKKKENQAT